ncbi:SMP-30/gluconolactonase/LRE family protein [Mycobacteroides abscessus]|uniref:SMP-30/gluconolactonase/LRE family protein n=1 Tax=Mycobacteroides abscessus TaxID=36809 RepID=UPI0002DD14FD|nr:SMP-30/gluconolactonase/LRE family protein [Mycobacteroides abscessus]ORA30176.1 strictosidine synthase [Mycobacteroides abscessus subsp. bolletii]TPF68594.1 strictosidine synthase [Mycobacteroides abscessus subsp. bolletii]BBB43127.1 Strictosidine synthase family protein [Mycobacteroides abscessus subsp. bolletii BD]
MAKPSIDPVRWQPPGVRALSLEPQPLPRLSIVALPGHGPEDVVADAVGNIWAGVADGRIFRISPDDAEGAAVTHVATTEHPPLGLHIARDGRVLICSRDKLLALDPASGKIEPVVTKVDGPPLIFCSNVTESTDGTIYFSESTARFPFEQFMAAILEGRPTGRVFRRDPDGTVTTIATGLAFTNGVTITADGSALIIAETVGRRVSRYALTGPAAGTLTPVVEEIPGMPDNISTGADGRIWITLASPRNALAEWLLPRSPAIRKVLWRLPDALLPGTDTDPWVIAVNPDTGDVVANITGKSRDLRTVTGVVESGGRLWMGCIGSSAVGHISLADIASSGSGP